MKPVWATLSPTQSGVGLLNTEVTEGAAGLAVTLATAQQLLLVLCNRDYS